MKGGLGEGILILGCGGHAKSVSDSALAAGIGIAGYVGDRTPSAFSYRGIGRIGSDADLPELFAKGYREVFIGVGYLGEGKVRQGLRTQLTDMGFRLVSIVDPTAAIAADAVIGAGVFVGKNAVVNAAATVGDCAIINSGAIVDHDCRVGGFTHIAVGAAVCGGVSIGEACLIGANATVIQGVRIGDNVIVGAGAAVTKDLPAGSIAAGVPAAAKGKTR
ncbi:MAG: acetyltransferase [Clostridiales bacterium]|nr:acetyltransferase [Clostridiales bacterium]